MFPNLLYAMTLRGLLGYQLAAEAGIHESRFSRCQRGRLAFAPAEMALIAKILRFDEAWLFTRPTLPHGVRVTAAETVAAN